MGKLRHIFWLACSFFLLCGCDPLTVHKVATTVFDGVPSLPPAEQYCKEYHEKKVEEERNEIKAKDAPAAVSGSIHPPYGEKRCEKCHDKTKDSGLILPKEQLCFLCHPNIIKGYFVHGPASVGGCLECHDPHSSLNPSLLKVDRKALCGTCHQEKRMAEGMHDKVTAKGMLCMDCHNPHSGAAPFFLR